MLYLIYLKPNEIIGWYYHTCKRYSIQNWSIPLTIRSVLRCFFSCIIKTEMRIFTLICKSKPNCYYNTTKTDWSDASYRNKLLKLIGKTVKLSLKVMILNNPYSVRRIDSVSKSILDRQGSHYNDI